jgi:hypothetical protein
MKDPLAGKTIRALRLLQGLSPGLPLPALEPLIKVCRPTGKPSPQDLRRTLSAVLWRHQNGAKWRAVPEELGPLVAGGPDLHPLGTRWCL